MGNKKKTWIAYVLPGTNIPFTEVWWGSAIYDVDLEETEPENVVFDATLKYYTIEKGYGSGCKVLFTDVNRTYVTKKGETEQLKYGVFLVDVDEIIDNLDHGIISGTFNIAKRGKDYGIKLVNKK